MTTINDQFARRNVTILVIMQAVLGSQMPMIFIVAGLAGQKLASNICWATLPISVIVFSSMTTAPWLGPLMQKYGRRTGFLVGTLGGGIGAIVSAYGLYLGSFYVFLVGSYFAGVYMSAQAFFRFAATDMASDTFRPKAISYVMAGGLVSAILGPQLEKITSDATVIPFMGVYLGVLAINVFGSGLLLFLKRAPYTPEVRTEDSGRSFWELLKTPRIAVAIICAMVSYSLMNLLMTSTPLAVVDGGYSQDTAADIVSAHVLAMFIPSFFTGHLIARFGVERIMALGLVILTGAAVVGLSGFAIGNFYGALILLGIGWNFGFIGATSMLAGGHSVGERGRVQGMNDFMVFGLVTVASISSGTLMNCTGGSAAEGWTAVNLATLPFLALGFGALIWLALRGLRAT